MSEQKWKAVEANLVNDGDCVQIKFIHKENSRWHHNVTLSADTWFRGSFAEFKLAEFEEALSTATKILEGRR